MMRYGYEAAVARLGAISRNPNADGRHGTLPFYTHALLASSQDGGSDAHSAFLSLDNGDWVMVEASATTGACPTMSLQVSDVGPNRRGVGGG